jgi:hypothetical protein
MIHAAFVVFATWAVFHAVFIDRKERKSPQTYRRERQFHKAERDARRLQYVGRIRRERDDEKRKKRLRRYAVVAVKWALDNGDWASREIAGAIIRVLAQNPALVEDHDALAAETHKVLRQATCQ